MPITVAYVQLYHQDHFAELTGKQQWEMNKWLHAEPEEHICIYRKILGKAQFDILQPQLAPPRKSRKNAEFIVRDGLPYQRDRSSGRTTPLNTVSGHAADYIANQTQYVFDKTDADKLIAAPKAEELIATGVNDFVEVTVRELGKEHFILSGGVVGTLYGAHNYIGLTNMLEMIIEKPGLIDYLCHKILEQNIEIIRQLAAAGGDAIYVDDAMVTSDIISVKHYERFSLPYMKEMVREIHDLGHKAILIYFGGIADRAEQIASIEADGLLVETSMKGYINSIEDLAEKIGDRITLYGNIDPIAILQNGSDQDLEREIARQVAAGRDARGFIISTGSPVTPSTPISRLRKYIGLCHGYGAGGDRERAN